MRLLAYKNFLGKFWCVHSKLTIRVAIVCLVSFAILGYYAKYFRFSLLSCATSVECGKEQAMDITPVVYDMYLIMKSRPVERFDIHTDIVREDTTQALESRAVEFLYPSRYDKVANEIFVPTADNTYANCFFAIEGLRVKLCSKQ